MRDRTSMKWIAAREVWLLSLLLLAACGDDSTDDGSAGTLVVRFELGNKRTCDAVGVAMVRAELNDMKYVQQAPCSNGQVRFRDIPAGSYHIELFGVDSSGVDVMDSHTSKQVTANVSGDDATNQTEIVTLTAAPAHLLVRWNFGFGTCKGVGIDRFVINAWRGSGDDLLFDQTLACTLEGDGKDQYREIADPDRRMGGDEAGEVSIQPYDRSNVPIGMAAVFKFNAPGPGHDVKLSITCDEGACTGTGKPD
jgi:hypothetical protein